MGYYTIRLLPASQDMTMIVTEFVKFKYNRLPMGMCVSVDIFKAKVDELISDIDGAGKFMDDILVLSKEISSKHIEQLRIIFGRLRTAGIKCNAHKCSLGLKGIT